MESLLDHAAGVVLARYPAVLRVGPRQYLANRGGFSGADLWRLGSAAGPLCLRAWPAHETGERVALRHALMAEARSAGLAFVPAVLPAAGGATAVSWAGHLWELAEWLPGKSDFHDHPTTARLQAACAALAHLHLAWGSRHSVGVCPAVRRRLDAVVEWEGLLRSGWQPLAVCAANDSLRPAVGRALRVLERHLGGVPGRLRPWVGVVLGLQPCLCDVWHDHVLFEGERVTGLVDYGSVKVDNVAADLARLLGSLIEDDGAGWRTGVAAYRWVRPLAGAEEALARELDRTGVVLGVVSWLRWLLVEGRAVDREAAGQRLVRLVERIEAWE
jgi:homoserine kinase type II